jgi:hypothetical protein
VSNFRVSGELSLDGTKWQAGLNRAESAVRGFSSSVSSRLAAVFSVGAISALSKATIDWASNLRDVGDALGVNVEWLQKMANGAALSGGKLEDIEKFLAEMNKSREDALNNPTGKNAQALGRLGFSQGDIRGLSTQDFFDRIVKQFAGGATTQLSNDVQEVGGKSARNLLAAFASQFQSDTPILAEEMVNQLDEIGDRFTLLGTALKVSLAPAIITVANTVQSAINQLKQFGALLGGASAQGLTKKEIAKALLMPGGVGKFLAERLFSKDALDAVNAEAADQLNESDKFDIAQGSAAAARKRREKSAPLFNTSEIGLSSLKKGAGIYSDALLASGNFLGAGGSLQRVADKNLERQTTLQERYLPYLAAIAAKLSFDTGIQVPP